MPHNMTVTIDDPLWDEMKKHYDIRWSAIMKEAVKNKLEALSGQKTKTFQIKTLLM